MSSSSEQMLLGDIGGTNARLALFGAGRVGPIDTMSVADYPRISDAIQAFLSRCANHDGVCGAILAIAGPIHDGRAALTNSPWVVDAAELRGIFGWPQVRLINDFEALAWSLPGLGTADVFAIGGGKAVVTAPAVVLGPGTGLGLACFVPHAQGASIIASEGGHATLAGTCRREDKIIEHLRERLGHVSAERALSGEGLVNLYQAIGVIDGVSAAPRNPAEITAAALDGSCRLCRETLDLFCAMLGAFAGNAALSFGSRGGVYIGGGIVPRIVDYLAKSEFRTRYEAKGRFKSYLASIPTAVITHPDPAFLGLEGLARQAQNGRNVA